MRGLSANAFRGMPRGCEICPWRMWIGGRRVGMLMLGGWRSWGCGAIGLQVGRNIVGFGSLKYFIKMKASARKKYQLSDIIFYFRPVSAIFQAPNTRALKIYLEKNVQILGEVQEVIPALPARVLSYSFSSPGDPISFRVTSEKFANYQLSLYEVKSDGSEVFLENSKFKLSKFVEDHFREFIKLEEQLYSQLKEKEGSTIPDLWRVISNNFTFKYYSSGVKFQKTKVVVEYSCTPVNDYDQMVKIDDSEIEKRRAKQKKKTEYVRSRTVPDLLKPREIQLTSKLYHESQSQIIVGEKSSPKREKKLPTKEELKAMALPLQKKGLRKSGSVQDQPQPVVVSNPESSSGKKGSPAKAENASAEKPMEFIQEVSQSAASEIRPPIETDADKFYEARSQDGYKPVIHISHFRELVTAETHNYSKLGNLSLESTIEVELRQDQSQQSSAKLRKTALGFAVLLIYSGLIIFLMHPISKIG